MTPAPISDQHLTAALSALPAWRRDGDSIARTYQLPSFADALAFMQDCAPEIERLAHHPEWTNVYDKVIVRLSTHDAGNRITTRDLELAKIMDWVAQRFV